MTRFLSLSIYAAASLMALGSCDRQVPDGTYRVKLKDVSNQNTSMTRRYEIETTVLKKIVLADSSGSNSTSIAPNSMTDDRLAKAEVVVTIELHEPGALARVKVNMEVKAESFTTRSDETLAVPGAVDISSIMTEPELAEDFTATTTLLRLSSDEGYLQITLE